MKKGLTLSIMALCLQGCTVPRYECVFQNEIYDVTPHSRIFFLKDGTRIKIKNRLVLLEINANGWISATDGYHTTQNGIRFQTRNGYLIEPTSCQK